MKTQYLMISSALFMAVFGILALFMPGEILSAFDASPSPVMMLGIQLMAGLYLGFSLMNWMAKTVLIGGIYARPLAIGNFFHFFVGSISLIKFMLNNPGMKYVWIACLPYTFFAAWFGFICFFSSPVKS